MREGVGGQLALVAHGAPVLAPEGGLRSEEGKRFVRAGRCADGALPNAAGSAAVAPADTWPAPPSRCGRSLDERPRGSVLTRVIGKLPVIGAAGGWLDERAGIHEAVRRTCSLLR
ncbi:hypothetical protein [Kineococcus sp. SYSU DK018]|uniref:hypothetical protein n=1 Tax=Kineococcus sp. SYSU DK018 TaxID=3383139 RepID=UPI003D7EF0A2